MSSSQEEVLRYLNVTLEWTLLTVWKNKRNPRVAWRNTNIQCIIMHSPMHMQVAMATDDEEAQEDELLALASIYNKEVFEVSREEGKMSVQFSAQPELPDHFYVQLNSPGRLRPSE